LLKLAEDGLLGPMAQEVFVSPDPRIFRGSCRGGASKGVFGLARVVAHRTPRSVVPRLLFFACTLFAWS